MQAQSIIYPMAALFLLNITVMFTMLFFSGESCVYTKILPRYFKLNKSADIPDHLEALSQNYNNLLELPLLFYIACLTVIVLNLNVQDFTVYAWLYVGFRYIHSLVHTTYNHILHRLFVFSASCVVLISMWVKIVLLVS